MSKFRFPLWFVRGANPAVAFTNSKAMAAYRSGRERHWQVDYVRDADELMLLIGVLKSQGVSAVSIDPGGTAKGGQSWTLAKLMNECRKVKGITAARSPRPAHS